MTFRLWRCLRKGLISYFQLRKYDVSVVQIQHGILPEILVCEEPLRSEEGESLLCKAMLKLVCLCVALYWMQGADKDQSNCHDRHFLLVLPASKHEGMEGVRHHLLVGVEGGENAEDLDEDY